MATLRRWFLTEMVWALTGEPDPCCAILNKSSRRQNRRYDDITESRRENICTLRSASSRKSVGVARESQLSNISAGFR